jgi:hypothetical protein
VTMTITTHTARQIAEHLDELRQAIVAWSEVVHVAEVHLENLQRTGSGDFQILATAQECIQASQMKLNFAQAELADFLEREFMPYAPDSNRL